MNRVSPIALALSLPVLLFTVGEARAQNPITERASISSLGAQANNDSAGVSISADGRWVAFYASASNLVAGDTNSTYDVFVRNRLLGTTERISVDTSGAQGNGQSQFPSISADGRYVAFLSYANNLVASDANGWWDIFVHDRANGTTERVSISSGGAEGNGGSTDASISADGRFVAFASSASNFVAGDTNNTADVFVRDRVNGTTVLVSTGAGGVGNFDSRYPSISANGRFVAFRSNASNLVPGDTNGWADIFVRDLQLATTQLASIGTGGAPANGDNRDPSISADGRFVAFDSAATNLIAGDMNGWQDIYVRDLQTGTTARASVDSGAVAANADSRKSSISASGRYVAFQSDATNLVAGDSNSSMDIFVRDLQSGVTERASVASGGAQAGSASNLPSISADGRCVAFISLATNLVAGDTNGVPDAFLRDRGTPAPAVYCTSGTTTNGCNASIAASANPSVSLANGCVLSVTNVEGQRSGLIFYGIDNTGFVAAPWASGTSFLCVKPPTQRTPIQSSGGTAGACDGSFTLDWNAYSLASPSTLGSPWSVGAKVFAQAWFRDPPAPKSTDLSNAIELTYLP